MLGLVRTDLPGLYVTNFFLRSIYENVFAVSVDGRCLKEIHQSAWRAFVGSGVNQMAPMSELLPLFEQFVLAARLNTELADGYAGRFGKIVVVLDQNGHVRQTFSRRVAVKNVRPTGLIMAGGFGRRLGEMTKSIPKPMLQIAGKPIAEHILESMIDNSITDIYFSLFHLGGIIKDHFGDGSRFGCRIRYIEESIPLGTAGCLSLIDEPLGGPLVMVNGDVLTNLQFGRVLDLHDRLGADLTMSTRQHVFSIPYGVVETEDGIVTRVKEKPKLHFDINVAIYVLSERVMAYTHRNRRIDMPEFIESLMPHGLKVAAFPLLEDWIDVGSVADFNKAVQNFDPADRPSLRSGDFPQVPHLGVAASN